MRTTENTPRSLTHVQRALHSIPWLLYDPQDRWSRLFCEILDTHLAGDKVVYDQRPPKFRSGNKKAYEVQDGVGIVELMGPIFPRANLMTDMSGATSAAEFSSNFSRAMDDDDVKSVLLYVDSPGGAVSGIFEAANRVYSARGQGKPIIALAEGVCASAAYLIASQADEMYCTVASVVGSIGVVMQIEDDTRQKLNDGIDVHTLRTGPLKAIGAGPVSEDQKDELLSMMDDFFGKFKGAVSRARPQVDIERASTGAVWIGKKAQGMKLVDGMSDVDELVAALSNPISNLFAPHLAPPGGGATNLRPKVTNWSPLGKAPPGAVAPPPGGFA